jgi:hypothetical protein
MNTIRIVDEGTQPYESKTGDFLEENTISIQTEWTLAEVVELLEMRKDEWDVAFKGFRRILRNYLEQQIEGKLK